VRATLRNRLLLGLVLACAIGAAVVPRPARAAVDVASAATERDRIERLLTLIEQATDVSYVRNGTAYDAATAVRFLRAKWDFARAKVRTAEDFIREVATQSGTTGAPYRIRYHDGREEDSAAFLHRLLAQPAAALVHTQ
jgi:hypothetical protein